MALVGLASQFYPIPSGFFLEGRPHTIVWPTLCSSSVCQQWCILAGISPVCTPGGYTGKIPIAGKYTIYFACGAFDLRGCYGRNIYGASQGAFPQFQ